MRPSTEGLKKWHASILAMQTLTKNEELEYLSHLLMGIAIAAFQNPLLRTVKIDDKVYIAHVTPYIRGELLLKFMDNPMEDASSEGDLRARIIKDSKVFIIERNMGKRHKSEVERSIDKSCSEMGDEMMRTGDFIGRAGQEFSTLLHATMSSYGSAFDWKRISAYDFSDFNGMEIIERENEKYENMPTYDIVFHLCDSARVTRKALGED